LAINTLHNEAGFYRKVKIFIRQYFEGVIPIVRIYKVRKNTSRISRRFERTKGFFGL